ncbi:MAG: BolA family transcriptional regulator [Gammaproteobacteria bacterium]|nr:BolA family transcriptional regulator [Gammaproteobacteria bacterium]
MITPQQIKQRIESVLSDASVEVIGDDGVHFEAVVVSPSFDGKTKLNQHRMVYDALGDMKADIHALAIKTKIA